MSTVPLATATGPALHWRGRRIPVVLPKRHDPRLKLSLTIFTLTFLGLSILSFQVSLPQIAAAILVCAGIDMVMAYRRDKVIIWPASGIQTGISIGFIFRVGGTVHGELWSVRGLHLFVLVALLSMIPKYVLRLDGHHVFNPSNVGLAWGLLVIGPSYVFSEHLWWAPLGPAILFAMGVILAGGWWVLRQVKMLPMAATFVVTFGVIIALLAVRGSSYWALWHDGPVGGSFYWLTIALSPEVLIFVFFMISDPQTAPRSPLGRKIYGFVTAVVAGGLIALQTTEFGIKVAIFSSLLVSCALVPLFEAAARRWHDRRAGELGAWPSFSALTRRAAVAARNPVMVAVVVISVAAVVNTALLATNDQIELIERGLTGRTVVQ